MRHELQEHKPQSVIGLMMTVLILYVILSTLALMKAGGYPQTSTAFGSVSWKPLAVFIRHWGLLLFLLPIIWVCTSLYLENGSTRFSKIWTIFSGLILLTLLSCLLIPIALEPGVEKLVPYILDSD